MPNSKNIPIKYTSRDFATIKQDLLDYAKRYYSDTYKNFNETSFGAMMIDLVSYVGDILSFYTDYSANESFLDTAIEYNNIIKHSKPAGYKFSAAPSSYGALTFYVIVPANNAVGLGPDTTLIPKLQRGSQFRSESGASFLLNEDVDFSNPNNEIVVANVDDSTGVPISYAIKTQGQVVSGELVQETFDVGAFEKFLRIPLGTSNVSEIISVNDAEGHEYFEVDYLSQNIIYKSVVNKNTDRVRAPNILKPIAVARRFVVEQDADQTYIQFGYGSDTEIKTDSIVDPSTLAIRRTGKNYTTDDTFDPSKLIQSDKFGIAPSNTKLTVIYRQNTADNVNASVDTVTEVLDPIFEFRNLISLDPTKVTDVVDSLEVTNEEPIIGDVSLPESDELKRRILDSYAAQNRAVNKQDYISLCYRMPAQFGSIKRATVVQDKDSLKRNLNLYVVSEDENGALIPSNQTIKNNLKTWINQYRMLNDTVDILDARIVNFGIDFEILTEDEVNKFAVLKEAIVALQNEFTIHLDIGEPLSYTRVYNILNEVDGVADVTKVKFSPKFGGAYGGTKFNFAKNKTADGRNIIVPENIIMELKFPNVDIIGNAI